MKNAAAYYTGSGSSLERQKQAVHEYASAHRMKITREFWDGAYQPLNGRSGFAALLAAVFGGSVAGGTVIVESSERLSHDLMTAHAVITMFKRHDIQLVLVKGRRSESRGQIKRAIEATLDVANVFERYTKLVRLRVGRDRRSAELGHRVEGNVEWKRFPPEHVQWALKLKTRDETMSLRQISKELEAKGYLNTTGKAYGPESVKRMLRDWKPRIEF